MDKLINQALICFVLAFAFIISGEAENQHIAKGRAFIEAELNKNYTIETMKEFASKSMNSVKTLPAIINKAVSAANAPMKYGEPIDELLPESGNTSIYSVGGGIVINTGTDELIGNYVIISHGNEAESIYGNMESISVNTMDRVKKGQLIGMYNVENEKDFYYKFSYVE